MTRPELTEAVAGTKNTAKAYNDNNDAILDYIDQEVAAAKTYTDGKIPSQTGNAGKYLTTNGTSASWDIPVYPGTVMFYGGTSAPSGWLVCDGSEISRTTYATLFSAISTNFGEGDGSTTFKLPNLIGQYVYGGTSVGTAITQTETATSQANKAHTHNFTGDLGFATTSAGKDHTHNYLKGVDSITLLPIIKI